ncbi:hypothetical protein ABBQ32_012426 [Trebouxia sp. C0010 RCD-2024]
MVSDTFGKDSKRGWQRTQEGVSLMWRNRYGRLLLLCPCLFVFLTLLWSPSVHPGLSVNIKAHTQSPTDTHKPMHVSWTKTPASKPVNTVTGASTQSRVMKAESANQHDDSPPSHSLPRSSEAVDNPGVDESSIGVLQQHLQNATAKSISGATEALILIQPALGLQPNSSAISSMLDTPPAASLQPEDLEGSSQVHMGFNHSVIHDSSESNDFSSVNGTDVIPISEMPNVDQQSHDSSADWAQSVEDMVSNGTSSLAPFALPGKEEDLSMSSAALATTASLNDVSPLIALHNNDYFEEELTASQPAEPTLAASNTFELNSEISISESVSVEELSPEVATANESTWVHVDPYSDNLQGMIHATSRLFRAPGKFPVTRGDLVAALPTDKRHFPIVEASKAWRKDMRTYVALGNETVAAAHAVTSESQEVWGYWPDDNPLKGLHPGDSRAALTPFLAHEAFNGDYKWILYGDDDTFFFVDGVLELLQDFDPSLPYFITDHYWWGDEKNESMNYHPHERAPRCLPCHWNQEDEERSLRADGYRPFQPYIGCPCTAERICKTDDRGYFADACEMPLWKPDTEGRDFRVYTMHGGAGALMSIGLMERLPLSFMDKCMSELGRSSGGDALISVCLWRAGYGFTDPGYSFYHWEAKSFDPGPENSAGLLSYLEAAISNTADQYSLELLSHVATSHLRSHNQGITGTTHLMQQLASMYEMWREKLQATVASAQMHATQHQKVMPMIESTTGIANWRR